MTRIITVRGTGEARDARTNMLSQVKALVPKGTWVDLDYPASISIANPDNDLRGASESLSRLEGRLALRHELMASGEPTVLVGYSLGALVISDYLEEAQASLAFPSHVRAVVNIANPARARGHSYGHPSYGFGLDGEHGPWPDVPAYEIANPVDLITSAPELSPWRQLAIALRSFTFNDLGTWWPELMGYLPELQAASFSRNWANPQWWQAQAEAPAWLRGYLADGQHTFAYASPQWMDWQGRPISGIALAASAVRAYVE